LPDGCADVVTDISFGHQVSILRPPSNATNIDLVGLAQTGVEYIL